MNDIIAICLIGIVVVMIASFVIIDRNIERILNEIKEIKKRLEDMIK